LSAKHLIKCANALLVVAFLALVISARVAKADDDSNNDNDDGGDETAYACSMVVKTLT
jgi:hypothetical protein